jgi:hypothetical protein
MPFLLRIILIVVIVRALWLLARGVLEGAGYHRGPKLPQGVQLVRDPVCGVYLPPGKAVTVRTGDATAYFCSDRCRTEWQRSGRRSRQPGDVRAHG